ncbi:hypothetical protein CWE04_00990 [Thomasclavelia cocleata]|nr:hypothetical protein CWE04_00990 [Thomasclavelia cocleata]
MDVWPEIKEEEKKMNELQLSSQMQISGGGFTTVFFCVIMGTAVYKMAKSAAGRLSIPRIISIEWR